MTDYEMLALMIAIIALIAKITIDVIKLVIDANKNKK